MPIAPSPMIIHQRVYQCSQPSQLLRSGRFPRSEEELPQMLASVGQRSRIEGGRVLTLLKIIFYILDLV